MEIDSVPLPLETKFNAAVDQQDSPSRFVVNDHSGCGQHRQARVMVKRSRRCIQSLEVWRISCSAEIVYVICPKTLKC
jgi:hypothetical protein